MLLQLYALVAQSTIDCKMEYAFLVRLQHIPYYELPYALPVLSLIVPLAIISFALAVLITMPTIKELARGAQAD